jgi:anti-sigma regulatory factor (Ser/Thr protein kinase)
MEDFEQGQNGDGQKSSNIIAEITRPAQVESFSELYGFVADVAKKNDFPDVRIEEIQRAMEVAFKNILNHSYKGRTGDIQVTCKYDSWGKFMIVISDSGDPSNLLLADVVFAGEDEPVDKERRASAKIIKKLIDNVEYRRADGLNILTFTVATIPRRV